jgi:hypothetical protein
MGSGASAANLWGRTVGGAIGLIRLTEPVAGLGFARRQTRFIGRLRSLHVVEGVFSPDHAAD